MHCVGRKMTPSALPVEAGEVAGVAEAEVGQEAEVAGDPVEAGGDGHQAERGLTGVIRVWKKR